jgi:dTDP-4-amino-4,6-dideoxygalactose transaminase
LTLILEGFTLNDEVFCQSFSFTASANPIVYLGANPVFIDSEKETWKRCTVYLEKAIEDRVKLGRKPKAILFVYLC